MTKGVEIFEESIGGINNAISYGELFSELFYSWFVLFLSVGMVVYWILYKYVGKLSHGAKWQSCMPYKITSLIWLLVISNYYYYEDVMLYEHSSNIHILKFEQSILSDQVVAKEFMMIPMQALLGFVIVCLIFIKTIVEFYDMRKDMCSIPKFMLYLWECFKYINMINECEKQSHTMSIPCSGLVLRSLPGDPENISLPPLFLFICSPLFIFAVRVSIAYFILVCLFESLRSMSMLCYYRESFRGTLPSFTDNIIFTIMTLPILMIFSCLSLSLLFHPRIISTNEEVILGLDNMLDRDVIINISFLLCVYSLRFLSSFKDDESV